MDDLAYMVKLKRECSMSDIVPSRLDDFVADIKKGESYIIISCLSNAGVFFFEKLMVACACKIINSIPT